MADGRRPNPPEVTGITVSDGQGNVSTSAFPEDGLNGNFAVPRLEGTGIPGDGIVVRAGDQQWDCMVDADGSWHVELGELDNGDYEFEVIAQDVASGNLSDAAEATLNNQAGNDDRQWQRAGAKDRIAKEGAQSYGPPTQGTPTPTGSGGGGGSQGGGSGGGSGSGGGAQGGGGQGEGQVTDGPAGGAGTGDAGATGGSSAGGEQGGQGGQGGPAFEKGNAPPGPAATTGTIAR